jgi:hypothetical protein
MLVFSCINIVLLYHFQEFNKIRHSARSAFTETISASLKDKKSVISQNAKHTLFRSGTTGEANFKKFLQFGKRSNSLPVPESNSKNSGKLSDWANDMLNVHGFVCNNWNTSTNIADLLQGIFFLCHSS